MKVTKSAASFHNISKTTAAGINEIDTKALDVGSNPDFEEV